MDSSMVLRQPFDIEVHKQTFINYLEVIILEDGTVVYATPSHQEKLISLACERLNVYRNELNDMCPEEYYCDFMVWLCQITGCVALWDDFMQGKPNEVQRETIQTLITNKLYRGEIR